MHSFIAAYPTVSVTGPKDTLQQATEGERKTERMAFHVEQRWIAAIRRLADLERLTYTQIVNQAFQQFFTPKST
jgi:hypothetical protein